jgi:hypothetical protein
VSEDVRLDLNQTTRERSDRVDVVQIHLPLRLGGAVRGEPVNSRVFGRDEPLPVEI